MKYNTSNKKKSVNASKPFKKAKNASWLDIVWRAVHQLAIQHPTQEYFHYFQDICRFIDTNWESLAFGKDKTSTWTNTVSSTITTHKRVFKPGPDQGYWGLRIHPDEDYDASTLKDDLPEELEAENQANLRLWKINKTKKTKGSWTASSTTKKASSTSTVPAKRGRKPLNANVNNNPVVVNSNTNVSTTTSFVADQNKTLIVDVNAPQLKSSTIKKMNNRKKLVAADNVNSNLNVSEFELTPIENRRKRKTGWGEKKSQQKKKQKLLQQKQQQKQQQQEYLKNPVLSKKRRDESEEEFLPSTSAPSSPSKLTNQRRTLLQLQQQQIRQELEQIDMEEQEESSISSDSSEVEIDQTFQPTIIQQQASKSLPPQQPQQQVQQPTIIIPQESTISPDVTPTTTPTISPLAAFSTASDPFSDWTIQQQQQQQQQHNQTISSESSFDCPSPDSSYGSEPTDEEDEYVDIVTVSDSEEDSISSSADSFYQQRDEQVNEFYDALHQPFDSPEENFLQSFESSDMLLNQDFDFWN